VHENIVLLGDAAHTAHFSIGSGTKLAMEDAIELARCFADMPGAEVNHVLKTYEDRRWVDSAKLQKTAQTSLEWFENVGRYFKTQTPIQFTFNELSRSKRITYDNLRLRDPAFVEKASAWFAVPRTNSRRASYAAGAYAAETESRTIGERHIEREAQPEGSRRHHPPSSPSSCATWSW
jgi:hypothetical protein